MALTCYSYNVSRNRVIIGYSGWQSTGRLRPGLNIRPVPDERAAQLCDRFREIRVTATPGMHNLGTRNSEALRDFRGTYERLGVHSATHATNLLRGRFDHLHEYKHTRIMVR